MSPLRLLDLVADVGPGVEASLVALAPALASRGMRIAALCAGAGPLTAALQARGVRVHVGVAGDTLAWNAVTAARAGANAPEQIVRTHAVDAVADRLAALYGRLAVPSHLAATAGERVTAIASR